MPSLPHERAADGACFRATDTCCTRNTKTEKTTQDVCILHPKPILYSTSDSPITLRRRRGDPGRALDCYQQEHIFLHPPFFLFLNTIACITHYIARRFAYYPYDESLLVNCVLVHTQSGKEWISLTRMSDLLILFSPFFPLTFPIAAFLELLLV